MQHETTPNDNQTALPEPKFGEWLRGIYASESNPHRDGMYVRTIRRTGKLNPGVHYEVTDGNGEFWMCPAQSVERLATTPAAQVQQEAVDVESALEAGDPNWRAQRRPNLTGSEQLWYAVRDIAELRRFLAGEAPPMQGSGLAVVRTGPGYRPLPCFDKVAGEGDEPMSLRVALDFADNPRPHHTLAAPADTNGELYRALRVIAAAYRATHPAAGDKVREWRDKLQKAVWRNSAHRCEYRVAVEAVLASMEAAIAQQPAPPSAPVGVEGFDEWFDEYTKNNYTDEMLALAAWQAALAQAPARNPWQEAVDEARVTAHLGIAADGVTREQATAQLGELIDWHIAVATDPAVNGGFKLVPVAQAPAVRVTDEMARRAEIVREQSLRKIASYGSAGVEERHNMAMRAALEAALGQGKENGP